MKRLKQIVKITLFYLLLHLIVCYIPAQAQANYPTWLPDAVFYQIFPERFRNGDASNDPDRPSLLGSWPHDTSSAWQASPWTADWYKLQPWEEANNKGFGYNVQRRRFGGDIQGIIEKLDYLKNLGINAIYLNPMFESPSLHKYDAATYIHIDDNFGPNPSLDKKIIQTEIPDDPSTWKWSSADSLFLKLIKEAHARNIRIILDGVFNHVGIRHWAFLDVEKNQQNSKFKDWFTVRSWDNPATPENEFKYAGWVGVRELPELKEDENGLIAPVKKHVFDILERWMDPDKNGDPSDGIDGWRLDVAEMVHHNFWKEFRTKVKSLNPQAYITGELFWDDWGKNKLMDPAPWLKGDEFDGVMNYRWAAAAVNFFVDKKDKISASMFFERLKNLDESYAPEVLYQMQNLLDSHDTERLATTIINPDLQYDRKRRAEENSILDIRKPNEEELRIYRLMALFQFTYPGAPMIYYGEETGMWGADDPDERKPMVWPDFIYENEVANITKTPRPVDKVKFDQELHDFYKKLIHLRNGEPALRRGDFSKAFAIDQQDVIAYVRKYMADEIFIIINNSGNAATIDLPISGKWKNLWTDEILLFGIDNKNVTMDGKRALILKKYIE